MFEAWIVLQRSQDFPEPLISDLHESGLFRLLLPRSSDWDTYSLVMYPAYPNQQARPLALDLVQILWDRGEANGPAQHMTDKPLPNTPEGAVDAVGIALNLLPAKSPQKFVDSGRRPYEHGWVLWFDYGAGRYINFFLNQEETQIEAVVGGVEATSI